MNRQPAQKTEYKGHLYDSRNTAIFARVNELMQERNSARFPYQMRPNLLNFAGHQWDLCIDKFVPIIGEILGTRNYYEYQEEQPSEKYVNEISQHAIAWAGKASQREDHFVAVSFHLVWGDPIELAASGTTYNSRCLATTLEDVDKDVINDFGEPEMIAEAMQCIGEIQHRP